MVYLRITLGLFFGLLTGGMVNGSFIHLGKLAFPYPPNFSMDLFYTLPLKYYLFPFMAHALGTLSGCLIYLRIAAKHSLWPVYVIGTAFFGRDVLVGTMINAPLWFDVFDLVLAYFPMAWLSTRSALTKTA
ncbi:MAG: hypothetical protein ACKO4K_09105 [Flavobacteriales bacterium]